jgi:ribose transport system permease protein
MLLEEKRVKAIDFKNNMVISVVKKNRGIILVLLLIGIILSVESPYFLTYDNQITVLRQITNNMYLALGMAFVMILGGIDLSVGAVVAMCGTLTVGFIVTNHLPIWLAIILSLSIGTFLGFTNGVVISYFKVPAFIITLASMNVARGVAYIYSGGQSTRIMNDVFNFIGTGYLGFLPLPVLYMIVLISIFVILLNKTKFGNYVYAVGGNRESAHLSGVPIKKVEIIVYTVSGFLSAFAGLVLCSRMYSGQPSIGNGYEMDAIAACVLGGVSMSGGVGRISGTIFGVMIIGIISNGLNLMNVSSYWQLVVKGLIIAIAVLIDAQKGKKSFIHKFFAHKSAA